MVRLHFAQRLLLASASNAAGFIRSLDAVRSSHSFDRALSCERQGVVAVGPLRLVAH